MAGTKLFSPLLKSGYKIIKFWRTSISSVVQMWCKHIKQKTQLIGIQIIAFLFRTRSGTNNTTFNNTLIQSYTNDNQQNKKRISAIQR